MKHEDEVQSHISKEMQPETKRKHFSSTKLAIFKNCGYTKSEDIRTRVTHMLMVKT